MAVYSNIQLDLCKKNSYKAIPMKQLDTNSRFLRVELLNNGNSYDFNDDVTVILASTRNGETKAYKCAVEDGYIVAPLTSWMLAEDGYVECEIVLLDTTSNSKLSSFSFSIYVDESIYNDETISQDENYNILIQLITDVDTAVKSCNTAAEKATEIYNIVETKLNNGELKGDKGEDGVTGQLFYWVTPDDSVGPLSTVYEAFHELYQNYDNPPLSPYLFLICKEDGLYSWGEKFNRECKALDVLIMVIADSERYTTVEYGFSLKGEKGEQGIQGIPGEKGEKGEPGTTDYNELANIPIKNINLTLQNYTYLTDIEDGIYVVRSAGYIKTTGGRDIAVNVGTEIIVSTYSGVKAMTYQTGKTIKFLNDSMTSSDKTYSWLNTSHKDLSISSAATDEMLPTSKAVYDFVTAQVSQKQNDWELIRTVTIPENPEEDNSDIIWKTKIVDDKNYVIGFAFDRDNNGEKYELSDFLADGTVITKTIEAHTDNLSIYNDDKLICIGYRSFCDGFSWTMFFINFGYKCIPLILTHAQYVQNYSVVSFSGNAFNNDNLVNTNQSWKKIGFSSGGHVAYNTGTKINFYGKRKKNK